MKTISNQTCNEIKAVLQTFAQSRVSFSQIPDALGTSTRLSDAQRRAGLILKKFDRSIDKDDARKCVESQREAILKMLLEGERITPDDALRLCGCRRLSARIWDLRRAGYNIVRVMVKNPNGNDYARYSLVVE